MKKSLGNLALVAGVIISSLAAGEAQRVSRSAAVDEQLVGQVLHTTVASNYAEEFPDTHVWLDRSIESGKTLTAEDVSWLNSLGLEEILVLRRATSVETLSTEAALGRVFAEAVVLSAEMEEIKAGRKISTGFVTRLQASGLTEILARVRVPDPENPEATIQEELTWSLAEPESNPEGVSLLEGVLREVVSLPVQLKADSYIDAGVLERLSASGIEEVSVKIPRQWTWQGWGARWIFMIGIGITLLGVLLKRSKPDAGAIEEEQMAVARVAESLQQLESTIAAMTVRVDSMNSAAIHRELDPILLGPVYAIAEGRNSVRSAHGMRVFTSVMDAFSRGERKLNRCWSAAVDDYVDEARRNLHSALPALREAREALPGTVPPGPAGFESGFDEDQAGMPLPPDVPIAPGESHWADE